MSLASALSLRTASSDAARRSSASWHCWRASFFDRSAASGTALGALRVGLGGLRAVPQRAVLSARPVVKLPSQIVDRRPRVVSAALRALGPLLQRPQPRVAPRLRVLQGLALVAAVPSNGSNRASASRARRSAASSARAFAQFPPRSPRFEPGSRAPRLQKAPSATRRAPASPRPAPPAASSPMPSARPAPSPWRRTTPWLCRRLAATRPSLPSIPAPPSRRPRAVSSARPRAPRISSASFLTVSSSRSNAAARGNDSA